MDRIEPGKGRRKAKTPRPKEKNQPIHYKKYVNVTEVASILIEHLVRTFVQSKEMAESYMEIAEVSPEAFGADLERIFSIEEIAILMEVPQGPGILLGAYLRAKWVEEIEGMDDGG